MDQLPRNLPTLLKPSDHQYPWQWAESHCVITSASGLETGPYRYARAPYLRGISEALSPVIKNHKGEWVLNQTRKVVVMKAAQVGVSYCALHWIGFSMVAHPCPMLVIGPTEDYCKKLSNLKLAELLKTKPLEGLVRQSKQKGFGQERLSMFFPNGSLMLIGSNSPADLRQVSVRNVLVDDFDGCSAYVGEEGSLEGLLNGRVSSFGSAAKMCFVSSPTIKDHSNIETAYLASDQRRYKIPCPQCMAWNPLEWQAIKFNSTDLSVPITWQCPACRSHLSEDRVKDATASGVWVATYPGRETVGFHVSALCCLWVPWRRLVLEWLDAQRDVNKLQVFVNTRLGEVWKRERSKEADLQMKHVLDARTDYVSSEIPDLAFLTGGADVQKDRIECLVEAWDRNGCSWYVNHHILKGDPSVIEGLSLWAELGERLQSAGVLSVGIDSGGLSTSATYDGAWLMQEQFGVKCFLLKGSSTPRSSIVPTQRKDATTVTAPRSNRRMELWIIDTNRAKEEFFLSLTRGERHYHDNTSTEFVAQLFNETRTEKIDRGAVRIVYIKESGRTRNEALDCSVYSLASKELLKTVFGFTPSSYNAQRLPNLIQQKPRKIEFARTSRYDGAF